MNPFVAYAKLPMSFRNLYQSRRDGLGKSVVAIACAMTGLLIVNIWTLILLVSLVDHGRLASRRRLGPVEYAALCACLLIVELILVDRVFTKVERDKGFALRVASTSPRISVWYGWVSVVLLVVSTILNLGLSWTAMLR
jgi:hypothetical protein